MIPFHKITVAIHEHLYNKTQQQLLQATAALLFIPHRLQVQSHHLQNTHPLTGQQPFPAAHTATPTCIRWSAASWHCHHASRHQQGNNLVVTGCLNSSFHPQRTASARQRVTARQTLSQQLLQTRAEQAVAAGSGPYLSRRHPWRTMGKRRIRDEELLPT